MKGKSKFTRAEADAIINLIRLKLKANSQEQKRIRDKIRAIGFYASDFGIGGGYAEHDFLRVITIIGSPSNAQTFEQTQDQNTEKEMVSADALITSFPPISQTDAKVLILGTMPGERSLKMRQYYGHGGNQFWKIMFACLKEPYSDTYAEKVNLLQKHKIALWDVLQYCERKGSSDNAITGEVPNDFADFFSKHKNIKAILFNGHNAADYFNRYIGSPNGISCQVLPSTSPANTWSAKEEKMKIYGQALTKVLNK